MHKRKKNVRNEIYATFCLQTARETVSKPAAGLASGEPSAGLVSVSLADTSLPPALVLSLAREGSVSVLGLLLSDWLSRKA